MSEFIPASQLSEVIKHEKYYGLVGQDYFNHRGSTLVEKIHNWLRSHKGNFCKVCKIELGIHIED